MEARGFLCQNITPKWVVINLEWNGMECNQLGRAPNINPFFLYLQPSVTIVQYIQKTYSTCRFLPAELLEIVR